MMKNQLLRKATIGFLLCGIMAIQGCSAPLELPKFKAVSFEPYLTEEEEKVLVSHAETGLIKITELRAPKPEGTVTMPKTGESDIYNVAVTPDMAIAYESYIAGEGSKALAAVDRQLVKAGRDPKLDWGASQMRAQILMMMGRGSDALDEIDDRTKSFEVQAYGTNLSSLALRGEAKIWTGDYEAAQVDFARVAVTLKNWRLPTSYGAFPTNMGELVNLATAKFRGDTGMAITSLMLGDFKAALKWSEQTEALADDVFYVAYHPLYSAVMKVFSDMYYGRGINLAVLGSATIGSGGDVLQGEAYFDRAREFFNALNYQNGTITLEAMRAYAYMAVKNYDKTLVAADRAVALAAEKGVADMVWRVEVIRGNVLLAEGRIKEAEEAYRNAQVGAEAAIGSLTTDRSKRRFGAGKEDITLRLIDFDIERNDFATLFKDLERGRARAFVDLLANQKVAAGEESQLLDEITNLDRDIRAARLKLTARSVGARVQGNLQNPPKVVQASNQAGEELSRLKTRRDAIKDVLANNSNMPNETTLDLKNQLRELEKKIAEHGGQSQTKVQADTAKTTAPKITTSVVERIDQLLSERAGKVAQLRSRNPELANVLSVAVQELSDIQKQLSDGDVLIYALPAEDESRQRLFHVTNKSSRIISLSQSREDLDFLIEDFTDAVALNEADSQVTAARNLAEEIGLKDWQARNRLYIVPSGPFYFVPWGALDLNVPVVVLPTGGWLVRSPKALSSSLPAGILGDPNFHGEMEQLPGARSEALALAKEYGREAIIGDAATEQGLRELVGSGVSVLHLATHGIFDVDYPLNSAIMLSGQTKADPLTAAELFERPLPARLVVLSACETGAGQAVAGDDFLGLARSFYLSGTLSVVNSLWPIDDAGTKAFMEAFHSVAKGGDYGKAWLTARDKLRTEGYPPSVYGAFVLGGSPQG